MSTLKRFGVGRRKQIDKPKLDDNVISAQFAEFRRQHLPADISDEDANMLRVVYARGFTDCGRLMDEWWSDAQRIWTRVKELYAQSNQLLTGFDDIVAEIKKEHSDGTTR